MSAPPKLPRFPSWPTAEGTAWLAAGIWALLIYSAIPFARILQSWVTTHGGRQLFSHAAYIALVLALLALLLQAWRGRFTLSPGRWTALTSLVACYAWGTYQLRANPEEAFHLVQYGLLSVLLLRAFRYRLHGLVAHAAAFLLGALLGICDELIQWITPGRVFDVRDIVINSLAVLGVQVGAALIPASSRLPGR